MGNSKDCTFDVVDELGFLRRGEFNQVEADGVVEWHFA